MQSFAAQVITQSRSYNTNFDPGALKDYYFTT